MSTRTVHNMTRALCARLHEEMDMSFRPLLKQRHVDALARMAEQSGRDPNELLHELLDHATTSDEAPAPGTANPKAPAVAHHVSGPGGRRVPAVVTKVPPTRGPNVRPLGETLAAGKGRVNGEDAKDTESDEVDDAPPAQMKGDKPNPLKLWAGASSKSPATERAEEDDERSRLRRKFLRSNPAQKR